MDATAMTRYISETFDQARSTESSGDTFFTYGPPGDQWLLFATVVTGDTYDSVSDLSREGAYRLNLGLTKATYTARFGRPPTERDEHGVLETGHDYARRDAVMPHPHYASQHWVCVVEPSGTLGDVRELLEEAYRFAERKHANRSSRG
ncbi:DUF6194 family protein [Nonomuraea antimicrobica]|uniref:DUF6194 family protein n=1 Tax=Nonomuraea antimicrobica TaxID=561173 RepID=A0ABP7BS90_9ACTN